MDLIDIFRTFHPNVEYTPSSQEHMEHSPLYHILGHKSNLSKFKKIKIISSIFSDHSETSYETRYQLQEKTVRNKNTWRLNDTFLNNKQVTEEIKRKIKKFLETNDK